MRAADRARVATEDVDAFGATERVYVPTNASWRRGHDYAGQHWKADGQRVSRLAYRLPTSIDDRELDKKAWIIPS